MIREVYLAGAVRTPIGGFCGALEPVPAPALGMAVAKAALERARVGPDQVDELIFGNVISAGLGQNVSRQVGLGAGLRPAARATTINKVCGSALQAVIGAAQAIQCRDAEIVVAGGTENMSRAPYLLEKARRGYRRGHGELIDCLVRDGLWDAANDMHMGACAERCAAQAGFTREQQDDFAVRSFQCALAARSAGVFAEEIVPLQVSSGKEMLVVNDDEAPKKFNEEKLRRLPPAFMEKGTITAGNASSLSDGAAGVVVLSAEVADRWGLKPQARLLAYASCAREPEWFTLAPILAMERLLEKLAWRVAEVDLFEINEAFAIVPLAAMKELAIPAEKLNVFGGAIALGHPIGASGARILVTLLNGLKRHQLHRGIASICIGGGEGVAVAVELL